MPYGVGMHPYFTVGTSVVDSCVLTLPASRYFVTNSRSIPTGPAVSVAGTAFDFRRPRAVGGTVFDTGFADLARDRNGVARIELQAPSGRAITVWLDAAHQYVQIYSGDTLPDASRRRRSLAIEPYTCAADAFNNGFGVRTIKPGCRLPSKLGSESAGPVMANYGRSSGSNSMTSGWMRKSCHPLIARTTAVTRIVNFMASLFRCEDRFGWVARRLGRTDTAAT